MVVYSSDESDVKPSRPGDWRHVDMDVGEDATGRFTKRKAGRSTSINDRSVSTAKRQEILNQTSAIHRSAEREFDRAVVKAHRGDGDVSEVDEPPRVVGGFYAT